MKKDIDDTGRQLTLKKPAPEWFNDDCPSIYNQETGERIWYGWSMYSEIQAKDEKEYILFEKFKTMSRFAFLKKYPRCARIV